MSNDAFDFIVASIIGLLGWFFGGLDGFIKVLITFAVIDYLSGLAVALWVKHNLSSSIGFKGISKKILMFCYIGNEGISIIENADELGVPFPQALKERFLNLKEHKDKISGGNS